MEKATFAGGCFWCVQEVFDHANGVVSTVVGYTGGHKSNPTYEEVCSKTTGHLEAIEVYFDPQKISYQKLLEIFWLNIDPTRNDGQFADKGPQYRPAIIYHNEVQKRLAEESKKKMIQKFSNPILVDILPAQIFYPAEEYHQKYYNKNKMHYQCYHDSCGRISRLKEIWGK